MKKRKVSLKAAIITTAVGGVLSIASIVGTVFAYQYQNLLDVYLTSSDYSASEDSKKLCEDVANEGAVLLKNEDDALPLAADETDIALLGQNSVDFVYGGSGSGSVDTDQAPTLKTAFEREGYHVDETLWNFYTSGPGKSYRKTTPDQAGNGNFAVNEVPQNAYTSDVLNSLKNDDVAVVSLGRSGGESADIPTSNLKTGYTYLQIDQDERDLLKLACDNFEKVILVINSNNPIELGILEDEEYENIKAAIWIGGVGQEGIYAIPNILKGDVNPSGRLVDTYAYDSKSAPSIQNLGDYNISNSSVDRGNKYLVYGEGIYVGYRYYETRYEDKVLNQGNAGDYNYSTQVQYPFGYGLSYTTFEWSDFQVQESEDKSSFEVTVHVTNTGDRAGKDVIELYAQKPYTEGGVETSAIELVGFDKTIELDPSSSADVTITIDKEDLTSYDYQTAKTYVLTPGDYYFAIGRNAHDALNNILALKGKTVNDGMDYDGNSALAKLAFEQETTDSTTYSTAETGNKITNLFEDVDINYYSEYTYLSRSDWEGTYPTTFLNGTWNASQDLLNDLKFYDVNTDASDDEIINDYTFVQNSDSTTYTVHELIGVSYDDPKWDDLINQLSYSQMTRLIRLGGYSTIQIDKIKLPSTQDKDGPSGVSGTLVSGVSSMAWPAEILMASTWNTDMIKQLGVLFGQDTISINVAGVYGPGANIHRSPYSGRNFEYYSEDAHLSYAMAKSEIEGLRSKGVITYTKHFFLNDQETNRYGGAIFANEQAIREIYAKGFQGAVDGGTNAMMAAMNRIGSRWIGAHKGAMTDLLRNEWGFEGMVITDQASVSAMFYQDIISGLWAGTDIWLNTNQSFWQLTDYQNDKTMQYYIHRAAKNICYAITNSWAVDESYKLNESGNQIENTAWTFPWRPVLITIDCLIFALSLGGIGYCWVMFFLNKKSKESD